jgi:16S rRNA (adenine1518-N6/adenine1519-N6)-dimethyltransferase
MAVAASRHVPRKRFGQHFLVDRDIIARLIAAIGPRSSDHIVEIGPGLGALTDPLLERVRHLHAVELDRDLCRRLRERHPEERLTVHQADVLHFDFAALPAPLRIVGNLPYNISTPILFHIAATADRCTDLHFMLQQEVVERMVANPSEPEYGRLSVMLQYRFRAERLFEVPPAAFRPPPKIHSAVVRLVPRPESELDCLDEALLSRVVAKGFSMRRKTVRNSLSEFISAAEISGLGIEPSRRAETFPVATFVTIVNWLARRSN